MKSTNSRGLLFVILMLFFLPASFYVGYKYGYKKAGEITKIQTEKKAKTQLRPTVRKTEEGKRKAIPLKQAGQTSKKGMVASQKEKKETSSVKTYSLTCEEARQNTLDFLSYLNQRSYLKVYLKGKDIKTRMMAILRKLSQNPPDCQGEGMKSEIMIDNIFHLFRTLSIKDIRLIKQVIQNESDQIEYVMRWYYVWLTSQDRCPDPYGILPSMKTAYTYASFFLNTIGGRAYIYRRPNPFRLLLTYYCILIVHNMAEKGENRYGIDISPQVKVIMGELKRYPELNFQSYYIETLKNIIHE